MDASDRTEWKPAKGDAGAALARAKPLASDDLSHLAPVSVSAVDPVMPGEPASAPSSGLSADGANVSGVNRLAWVAAAVTGAALLMWFTLAVISPWIAGPTYHRTSESGAIAMSIPRTWVSTADQLDPLYLADLATRPAGERGEVMGSWIAAGDGPGANASIYVAVLEQTPETYVSAEITAYLQEQFNFEDAPTYELLDTGVYDHPQQYDSWRSEALAGLPGFEVHTTLVVMQTDTIVVVAWLRCAGDCGDAPAAFDQVVDSTRILKPTFD